ncbi:MAG: T9SS type A sorting domain-containing protein [Bacteroidetes bacterium]|nr:T9SS type A sorting domain-containing protein [Bacteroidota bacterium]
MIVRWSVFFLLLTVVAQAQYGTWRRVDQVNPYGFHNLFVLDDSAMYVASSNGLYKSRDGGRLWREIIAPDAPEYNSSIVPDPASAPTGMVMNVYFRYDGKGTSGVFRSFDGGRTWGYLGGPVGNWGGYASPAGNQGVFMLCSPDGVVHLDVFGTARKYVDGLPTSGMGTKHIATLANGAALLYAFPNNIYLSGSGPQPWKTTWRSANTWTEGEEIQYIHTEGNLAWAGTSTTGILHASYPNFQWVHASDGLGAPGDPSMNVRRIFRDRRGPLVAVTYGGLYSSSNGNHWSPVQSTLPDWGKPGATAVDFEGRYGMHYGRDSIFVSEDEARTWELRLSGLAMDSIRDIFFFGGDLFAADHRCLFRARVGYQTGTRHWRQSIEGLADPRIRTLAARPDSTILAFGLDGQVYGLPLGSAAWLSLSADLSGETVTTAASAPGGLLLAGTEQGAVAVSRDGGMVWEYVQRAITTAPVRSLLAVTDSLLYAGTFGEGLQRSTDAGATWALVSAGLTHPNITALLQTPDGDLYAGSYGMGVYRSTDFGFTWAPTATASPGQYVTGMVTNFIGVLAVATYDRGVCMSRKDGTDWTICNPQQTGLHFVRLMHEPTNNFFYALTADGALYGTWAGLATAVGEQPAPARFELHSVYPNPFRDRVDVAFTVRGPGTMRIALSDLLGREVAAREETITGPGLYHRTLPTTTLPPGAYMLTLEAGGEREMKIVTHLR